MIKKLALLLKDENGVKKLFEDDFDNKSKQILPKQAQSMLKLLKKGSPSKIIKEPTSGVTQPHFCDFHSHWGGILPVERLIGIYQAHAHPLRDWERRRLPQTRALNPLNMTSVEWMFLRLSAAILEHKGEPRPRNLAPSRGAHLMQYVTIYVWWWAYLTGIRDPYVQWAPANYRDLWISTFQVLDDLYVYLSQRRGRGDFVGDGFALKAIQKYLRATKTAPFDDAYVARSCLLKLVPPQQIDDDTINYLVVTERINYLQVSQPPEKIAAPAARILAYNRGARPQRRIRVHWLALIAAHRAFMGNAAPPGYDNDVVGDKSAVAMAAVNGDVGGGYVVGIDWAGPECQEFRLGPTISLVHETLSRLHRISAGQNRTVVFRPHVGEGCSLLEGGRSLIETEPDALVNLIRACIISSWEYFLANPGDNQIIKELLGHRISREILRHPDDSFQVLAGRSYQEAARRARNNVGTLIESIKQFYQANPNPGGCVKIRFGHATHANQTHAIWMKKLGIAADINMSSNLRTGALAYMNDLDEGDIWKILFRNWNWNPMPLVRHSLITLCNNDVEVVLGTDGQGVEVTRINYEYLLAYHLLPIAQFLMVTRNNIISQTV